MIALYENLHQHKSLMSQKKKDKRAPTETEYLTIENVKKVNSK